MRQWKQVLGVAVLVIVVGFFVRDWQNGRPRPGETVTPYLERQVQWTAGTAGDLGVRLYAHGGDGSTARVLDFSAVGWGTDPLATIAFYDGDQPLSHLEVALSHRC